MQGALTDSQPVMSLPDAILRPSAPAAVPDYSPPEPGLVSVGEAVQRFAPSPFTIAPRDEGAELVAKSPLKLNVDELTSDFDPLSREEIGELEHFYKSYQRLEHNGWVARLMELYQQERDLAYLKKARAVLAHLIYLVEGKDG